MIEASFRPLYWRPLWIWRGRTLQTQFVCVSCVCVCVYVCVFHVCMCVCVCVWKVVQGKRKRLLHYLIFTSTT